MRLTTIIFFTLLIGFAMLVALAPEVSGHLRKRGRHSRRGKMGRRRSRGRCRPPQSSPRTDRDSGCYVDHNGCSGPSGIVGWTRTFTPHCNKHDVCYFCGARYGWSRSACDRAFHRNMLGACDKIKSWWSRGECKRTAGYYYGGVRAAGWAYYESCSPTWCKDDCVKRYYSP